MDAEHPFCRVGYGRSMAVLEAAEALAEMTSWLWWGQQAPRELHLQCGFWTSLLEAQPGVCFFSSAIDFVDLIAFSSVQSLSRVWLRDLMHCSILGFPVHHQLTSRAYPNSCPLSQGCHPTISSSIVPSSFRLQSFPGSGSFLVSQFFTSGGQSIGVSALA